MNKNSVKTILAICFVLAFLFFVTPGMFLGGFNYIMPSSHVRVIQMTYTRVDIVGSEVSGFDMTYREEYVLNAEQVVKLGRLLSGSWYTRIFRTTIVYHVPPDVDSYYQYIISISNGVEFVNLRFGMSGYVLRSGSHYRNYNDWFRIRNSNWEEVLLEIIMNTDG